MTRNAFRCLVGVTLFLVAVLQLFVAPAATAAPVGEGDLTVRSVVLVGSRASAPPADPQALMEREDLLDRLLSGDEDGEDQAVDDWLARAGMVPVGRLATALPADGGKLASAFRIEEREVEVSFDVRLADGEVTLETIVSEERTVLSAPTFRTLLGERAIAVSEIRTPGGASEILFLAVEVARAPEEPR